MAEFKEQAHFKDVPKNVILHAIESISAGLIEDAKSKFGKEYGFKSELKVRESKGLVECRVFIPPYDYNFRWLVAPEEKGFLVTFIGFTPGHWYEFLFKMKSKLRDLVKTQWSALINFGVGFVTASYYSKKGKVAPREHIKKARQKVKPKHSSEHKETSIDRN
jgi:hypothetical protein